MSTCRGKYKAKLEARNNQALSHLLGAFPDIKLYLGGSPFSETTPKNQECMSASSDCSGAGKGAAAVAQSDRESQAGCP